MESREMTLEEVKAEASKLGYRLIKKQKYIPKTRCKCGRRPEMWYVRDGGNYVICPNCDIRTKVCKDEKQAWIAWNRLLGREDLI